MHQLDLPAGSALRLTATARPGLGPHRWGMRLFASGDAARGDPAHLVYGSQIGERDCEQRVDVPVQGLDCRVEVTCGSAASGGWLDHPASIQDDTPGLLVIGFSDPASTAGPPADVVLSLAFAEASK